MNNFQAKLHEQTFDGYKILYSTDDDSDKEETTATEKKGTIMVLKVDDILTFIQVTIQEQHESLPLLYKLPLLYNEGTLVQDRGYVKNITLKSSDCIETSQ